jgi:hypothetical protein
MESSNLNNQRVRQERQSVERGLSEDIRDALGKLATRQEGGVQEGSWQDQALCSVVDPEIFDPKSKTDEFIAKKYCSACKVQSECLLQALDNKEEHLVFGGLSPAERKKMIRIGLRSRYPS